MLPGQSAAARARGIVDIVHYLTSFLVLAVIVSGFWGWSGSLRARLDAGVDRRTGDPRPHRTGTGAHGGHRGAARPRRTARCAGADDRRRPSRRGPPPLAASPNRRDGLSIPARPRGGRRRARPGGRGHAGDGGPLDGAWCREPRRRHLPPGQRLVPPATGGLFAQTGSDPGLLLTDPLKLAVWYYPANSELLHAIGMVAFGNDLLSPVLNFGWMGLALLAAWCIGRPFGLAAATLLAAVVVGRLRHDAGGGCPRAQRDRRACSPRRRSRSSPTGRRLAPAPARRGAWRSTADRWRSRRWPRAWRSGPR